MGMTILLAQYNLNNYVSTINQHRRFEIVTENLIAKPMLVQRL